MSLKGGGEKIGASVVLTYWILKQSYKMQVVTFSIDQVVGRDVDIRVDVTNGNQ